MYIILYRFQLIQKPSEMPKIIFRAIIVALEQSTLFVSNQKLTRYTSRTDETIWVLNWHFVDSLYMTSVEQKELPSKKRT